MNNLSISNNQTLTMSSQEIAKLTGKSIGHIHRDFKVMVSELGLSLPSNPFLDLGDTSNLDDVVSITKASALVGLARKTIYAHFKSGKLKPSKGGVSKSELVRVYGKSNGSNFEEIEGCTFSFDSKKRISSISLNQELTMTLVSGYNVKLRNAIIKRWQELEQSQVPVNKPQIPTNFAEALQLAADQAKQLELAAPKVAFVDNFVERESLQNATQVAQSLKLRSANALNKILDEIGGVYSGAVKRSRVFTVKFINDGYGDLKQTAAGYPQSLFTAKGIVYLNELLTSEGYI